MLAHFLISLFAEADCGSQSSAIIFHPFMSVPGPTFRDLFCVSIKGVLLLRTNPAIPRIQDILTFVAFAALHMEILRSSPTCFYFELVECSMTPSPINRRPVEISLGHVRP